MLINQQEFLRQTGFDCIIAGAGHAGLFERMLKHPNIELKLNSDFKNIISIDFEDGKPYFMGREFKGKLVFTGRIDELCEYRHGLLPYRTLEFRRETVNKGFYQEAAIVNYPNEHDFTRITEFKHIHPVKSDKTTIVSEYPRKCKTGDIPYYPMFTGEAKDRYEKYRQSLGKIENLILVGRLAEYRYYDMDDTVKRALEVFEERFCV